MKTINSVVLMIILIVSLMVNSGCEKNGEDVSGPQSYAAPVIKINHAAFMMSADTALIPIGESINWSMIFSGGPTSSWTWWFYDVVLKTFNTKDVVYPFNTPGLYKVKASATGVGGTSTDSLWVRVGNYTPGGQTTPFQLLSGPVNTANGTMTPTLQFAKSFITVNNAGDTSAAYWVNDVGAFIAVPLGNSNAAGWYNYSFQTYDTTLKFTYGGVHNGNPNQWGYANVTSSPYYLGPPYNKMVSTLKNNVAYTLGAVTLYNPSPTGDTINNWTAKWSSVGTSIIVYLNHKRDPSPVYDNPFHKTSLNGFITANAKMIGTTGVDSLAFDYTALPASGDILIKFGRNAIEADYSMSRYAYSDINYGLCIKMHFVVLDVGGFIIIYEQKNPENRIMIDKSKIENKK